jgi:hypothetical protein
MGKNLDMRGHLHVSHLADPAGTVAVGRAHLHRAVGRGLVEACRTDNILQSYCQAQ